ncbi:transmembrane protein 45B [Prunus yedoensis var. nudiflora]|uniref:Transmembrane protein 45B n=1 Tax=Prunus yedoensis var. nudiflora TaxID=2094558 RepID=A0A314U641_PRUYE|nr:transmembrane protein 45B [Prunus yedoensis var. nudiflora]
MQVLDFPFLQLSFKLHNLEHATMFLHLHPIRGCWNALPLAAAAHSWYFKTAPTIPCLEPLYMPEICVKCIPRDLPIEYEQLHSRGADVPIVINDFKEAHP